jgi:hypothetical protein
MDSANKNVLRAAQALFLLNAAIWLVFGLVSIYRIISRNPDQTLTALIIAIFMFGNAAAMLLSGVLIARPTRLGYYFALAVLAVNILLTFTDEFGAFDLITLLIDLILIALLVVLGRRMRRSTGG